MVAEEDILSIARRTFTIPERTVPRIRRKLIAAFDATRSVVVILWTVLSRADDSNSFAHPLVILLVLHSLNIITLKTVLQLCDSALKSRSNRGAGTL